MKDNDEMEPVAAFDPELTTEELAKLMARKRKERIKARGNGRPVELW